MRLSPGSGFCVWLLFLTAAVLLTGTGWVGAQQQQQQPPPPEDLPGTVLRVTTRLVLVDVVVTDKSGRAVTDLTEADFTILEDGRPQTLAGFSLELPSEQATVRAASPPPLPPNVHTNRPTYVLPPGPLTVLLLDALNTPLEDQAHARRQMLNYLATQLKPGQRTAIFALGSKLVLLQDFTADPQALKAALEKYRGSQSVQLAQQERAELPAEISTILPAEILQTLGTFESERIATTVDGRVGKTLGALQAIARALAGFRGRKNLVWISGAFPFRLLSDDFSRARSYTEDIRRTANMLTDAQVAVYPVDARGLVGYQMANAAEAQRSGFTPLTGPGFAGELSARDSGLQDTVQAMLLIAEETGGRAFYNRNDIDVAVDLSITDGSTYYTLAYYPEKKKWDGRFRKIEVKVNRKDLQVRHRRGYYAVDPTSVARDKKTREQEMAAALTDPFPTSVVTFLAQVLPPAAGSREVTVNLLVDSHSITFESQPGGRQGFDLDFLVVAYSAAGERVADVNKTIAGAIRPDKWDLVRTQGLPYQVKLKVPPGSYELRLGVRDNRTGLLGTAHVPLVVPSS